MPERKFFASFIGINEYKQNPLSGCVKDVLDMDLLLREQLKQQEGLKYEPVYFLAANSVDEMRITEHIELTKPEKFDRRPASFDAVSTEAFAHLKKANDGDTCFLYYSGHGSQTEAPPEFWHMKADRQNETIVCTDSRDPANPAARDLIDKEIAFLLWDALKGKNIHCIVIMDCCHSGNNTRAAADPSKAGIRFRHVGSQRNKIPLEQYLGFKEGFYKINNGKVDFDIARYVHMAACRDAEKAQESNDGGLFSGKLIDTLRAGGTAKSYRELVQSLAITVRSRAADQNPVAFAREDEDLDLQFLGTGIKPYQPSYEVRYDFGEGHWILYGGSIHNIVASSADAKTVVNITGTKINATVVEVKANISILDDADMASVDQGSEDLSATIISVANAPVMIGIGESLNGNTAALKLLQDSYGKRTNLFFKVDFDNAANDPSYLVHFTDDNAFILAKPGNTTALFERQAKPDNFFNNVETVCKWISVGDIRNENSRISKDSFIFALEKIEGKEISPQTINKISGDTTTIQPGEEIIFNYVDSKQPAFRLKVAIKDSIDKPFFLAALHMEGMYGIRTDLVQQDNSTLQKSTDSLALVYKLGTGIYNATPLQVEPELQEIGINEISEFIKIFVSTETVNVDRYKQTNLQPDKTRSGTRTRGSGFPNDSAESRTDWTVFTFPIRIVGPHKEKELSSAANADFASFEIEVPPGFSAKAFAATGNDIQRKLNTVTTRGADDDETRQMISPPVSIWGDVIAEGDVFENGMSAASDNGVKALELLPSADGSALIIPAGKEILIKPKRSTKRSIEDNTLEETIIPFGYDEQLQLYYPLGYSDDKGIIHIQQLPDATPGLIRGEEKLTRSIGSSVKLFFKKIFRKEKTNTLTLYELNADNDWQEITEDPAAMRPVFNKDPNASIVLLIHGIFGSMKDITGSLKEMDQFPKAAKFVLAYDYENLSTPLPKTAEKLMQDLADAGFGTVDGLQLSIVAHSMGGLVARRLVEFEGADKFVKQLIFAGTPNAGSELAGLKSTVSTMITHALNVNGPLKYAITGLSFLMKKLETSPGETLTEMSPGSSFLQDLAVSKQPLNCSYSVLAGSTDLIEGYTGDDYFLKKIGQAIKLNIVYPGLTKGLFHSKSNDMAVTLDSMKTIPGFEDTAMYVLANDHLSYFSEKPSVDKLIELITAVKLKTADNIKIGKKRYYVDKMDASDFVGDADLRFFKKTILNEDSPNDLSMTKPTTRSAKPGGGGGSNTRKAGFETTDGDSPPGSGAMGKKAPFFANAYYSRTAVLNDEIPIRVNLSRKAASGIAATIPIIVEEGTTVDLVIEPKTGFEVVGRDMNSLKAPTGEDSPSIIFKLRSISEGEGKVTLTVYVDGIELGHINMLITVSKEQVAAVATTGTALVQTVQSPLPDLTLLITETESKGLTFRIIASESMGQDLYLKAYGAPAQRLDPGKYVQDLFGEIEEIAKKNDPSIILDMLQRKGMELFEQAIPEELRKLIWSLRDKIKTLKIDSEEPWIPWEICCLSGMENGRFQQGGFFCEAFEVTRWMPGHGAPKSRINFNKIGIVVPNDSGLKYVQDEKDEITKLFGNKYKIEQIPANYQKIIDAFSGGEYSAWHFSGHGSFADTTNPDKSRLLLEQGRFISPELINGEVKNLGLLHPLVFLNACQVGKSAFGLTGINSWASKFLDSGAAAFIGAYWSVSDDMAFEFATKFYERLLQGDTIGKAIKDARMHIKRDGDPTWLAYTVFAAPDARIG